MKMYWFIDYDKVEKKKGKKRSINVISNQKKYPEICIWLKLDFMES